MVKKYAREPTTAKVAKSSASDLRVHYKNTYETCAAIKGMNVAAAGRYLRDVLAKRRCIPFRHHNGHVGRTGQAKEFDWTQGRWPQKSVKVVIGLLQNLESNAAVKGLDTEKLVLRHVQVNRAQKGRRRTYRAHGRINPYLNCGCHIELWATEADVAVKKTENKESKIRLTRKQQARTRLAIGEGK